MKTIVAPGLAARSLGVTGWYSTNILGNRDGLVLDDEAEFQNQGSIKARCTGRYPAPDLHPDLYGELYHKIRINYYPPHGDNKKAGIISTSSAGLTITCRSRSISFAATLFWQRL